MPRTTTIATPRTSAMALIAVIGCGALLLALSRPLDPTAHTDIKDAKGQVVGRASLTDTPHGVLIRVSFSGTPAGAHAFHIHAVGKCEPPGFESAGDHFNPDKASHGFLEAKGPHAGDLPNVHVSDAGTLEVELLADRARLVGGMNQLLDADGAALVLHAASDDYATNPAGNAGARIACGVITR